MSYETEMELEKKYSSTRQQLMTDKQIKRADFFLRKYDYLKAEMDEREAEWEEIQSLYKGEREPDKETDPNAVVNIVLPSVEGQISAMTQHNITAHFKGKGFSDQKFAKSANYIGPTIIKENKLRQRLKRSGRRYILYGNTVVSVGWNPDTFDGFGLPEFNTPPVSKILIDGRIKDFLDIQKAEYIFEVIDSVPLSRLKKDYDKGEELLDAVTMGDSTPAFSARKMTDDEDSFTLFRIWTRDNDEENLQKIEMTSCGIILEESDPSEPYYKYVWNRYPIFGTSMYPIEGELYGFGDGKLLKPVQELLNKLYDQVIIAAKFSSQRRTFVDPNANVDPDEFDNDPSHPIFADNPNQYIKDVQGDGINPVVLNLITDLFQRVQEMLRFSSLMTGNNPDSGMTATQAGIQMQQGNTGVDDKRTDLSRMFSDAMLYALGLCMEFWPAAKAFRITEESEDFEWIDVRTLANIPEMVPVDSDFSRTFREKNPHGEMPKFMELYIDDEETGKRTKATKQIELDVDVSIGEGMPTSKIALFNIVMSLAKLALPDERTGQMRPILGFKQVRDIVEDTIGLKIDDYLEQQGQQMPPMMPQQQGMPGMNGTPQPLNNNPNLDGAGLNGMMKGGIPGASIG